MALKPFEWHFEMEKHLPVVNHGSQWESPASLPASSCPPEEVVCVFTLSVNGDNVKDQQFSCVFKMSGSAGGLPIPYRAGWRGSKSPALTGTLKNHNAHSCFVEAQLHWLYFPPSRWEKGPWVGRLPAPVITHPSAIKRESQCSWFVMLALVASSNTAWFKSPHLLFFFFYPFGKLIWRCFSPYWLVFRAPSHIPLPIPQAFLCLSCHVLFFSSIPVSASNLKETPVFLTLHIQCSADFVLAIFSLPSFEFKRKKREGYVPSHQIQPSPTNGIITPSLHVVTFPLSPLLHERWLRKYLNP